MPRLVKAGETVAARRRLFFQLVGTDGITPALSEAGSQPQISTDGAAWTSAGVGTLTHVGNGRYYADLTAAAVLTSGAWIESRYKSASTAECPGDSAAVVDYDPYSDLASVLARLSAAGLTVTAAAVVPASPSGVLTLVAGDDYLSADGRALTWRVETGQDLTGASWSLTIYQGAGEASGVQATVTCSAVAVAGVGYDVTAELTAAQTDAMRPSATLGVYARGAVSAGTRAYAVRAADALGHVWTPVVGQVAVIG